MKISIKILTTLACVSLLFSCGDKWLEDVKPQDGSLTPGIIFESEAGVNNALTGVYDLIKSYNYQPRTDTYGFKATQTYFEYFGNDMVCMSQYGWYDDMAQWNPQMMAYGVAYTAQFWNQNYKIINNCNAIIQNTAGSSLPEAFKAASIAEATVVRGWAYFQLSRIYQLPPTRVPGTALCVPIYTTPAGADSEGNPRATVDEVYQRIMEDLSDEVIAKLPPKKAKEYRADQSVAYAWRAQVNLEKGAWAAAKADAVKAAAGYPLMSASEYNAGFNKFNSEWIWGCPFNAEQSFVYASFFSFADMTLDPDKSGYETFFFNNTFVAKFADTDCRNTFFHYLPGAPATNGRNWSSTKFRSSDNAFTGDYVYIRSAEMLLIQAEAEAQLGASGDAQNTLFRLQLQRDPNAVKSTATGTALINEILLERRKELYGECATEYYDLRRYGKPMVRDGNQPNPTNFFTIQPDDKRWLHQIPRAEMDANNNIKPEDQNPL